MLSIANVVFVDLFLELAEGLEEINGSLLSITYKIFSYILLWRMLCTLNHHHPREQPRFESGYSTIDHLQTVSQLQHLLNLHNID